MHSIQKLKLASVIPSFETTSIVVSFTIEREPGKGPNVQGIMTNYGFIVPDPTVRNRYSVWFTGGKGIVIFL